jgi:predicted nucleic acid-binding protein
VRYIRVAVRSLGLLGIGEQSVLTLALKRPGSRVILDEEQARKAARRLGLPLAGTIGVIAGAKRQGLIPAVVPLFHAIQAAGSYLDDDLVRQSAAGAGEAWP